MAIGINDNASIKQWDKENTVSSTNKIQYQRPNQNLSTSLSTGNVSGGTNYPPPSTINGVNEDADIIPTIPSDVIAAYDKIINNSSNEVELQSEIDNFNKADAEIANNKAEISQANTEIENKKSNVNNLESDQNKGKSGLGNILKHLVGGVFDVFGLGDKAQEAVDGKGEDHSAEIEKIQQEINEKEQEIEKKQQENEKLLKEQGATEEKIKNLGGDVPESQADKNEVDESKTGIQVDVS